MDREVIENAKKILSDVLTLMKLEFTLSEEPPLQEPEDGSQILQLKVETQEPGFIIGYHGQTLKDLEFFVNLSLYKKTGNWLRISLNVGEYCEKREQFLRSLAERTAEKAKFLREPIALSPMSANERRIVHLALKDNNDVTTESVGEGDKRKIVIRPN